ncbi:hypothetical protein OAK15_04330 [Verrucomicrobia bacterium]|nr:hypothetical protein [Verrucomicrobiota bacterium]
MAKLRPRFLLKSLRLAKRKKICVNLIQSLSHIAKGWSGLL